MRHLIIALLLASPLILHGQRKQGQPLIDSLLPELAKAGMDTVRAGLEELISFNYSTIDPDKGIVHGLSAKKLSEQLQWKTGIASANTALGVNYAAKSDNVNAIAHYLDALRIYREIGNKNSEAAVLANLSLVYRGQSNYAKALEYAFNALSIKEDLGDKHNTGIILENIGTIYLEQKNYTKTMEYYSRALEIYQELGNKGGVARSLGNMGIVHGAKGDYAKALEYHLKGLETKKEQGNRDAIQNSLINIGIVYLHIKEYGKALDYDFQALKISEDMGTRHSIAVNLGNIGEVYLAIGKEAEGSVKPDKRIPAGKTENIRTAIRYLEKAINICEEIGFYGPYIEFSSHLAEAYYLNGQYRQAYETYKKYDARQDSVFSAENRISLAKMETRRELDLKDKDIIIKNKQLEIANLKIANRYKERVIFISGIGLLIVFLVVLIRRFSRRILQHRTALNDISQYQSHQVRGPVARIMGLTQMFNRHDASDPINKEVIDHLTVVTQDLDNVIRKVINKTDAEY